LAFSAVFFVRTGYFHTSRHTKRGYRHADLKVVGGSLLASLLISLCLNTVDVGGYIHRYLIENTHVYHSLIYSNEHHWSEAGKGRLGGKIVAYDKTKGVIVLRSFRKALWQVDITNAEVETGTLLIPGKYQGVRFISACLPIHGAKIIIRRYLCS
jgi:hypothetical protein